MHFPRRDLDCLLGICCFLCHSPFLIKSSYGDRSETIGCRTNGRSAGPSPKITCKNSSSSNQEIRRIILRLKPGTWISSKPSSAGLVGALWRNILIQPEEVIWIVTRLNCDDTVPSFLISLGDAILLVAAHKIYVNTRFHRWLKLVEESANPGNIAGIRGRFRPVRQQIHDEGSAAIAECGLVRCDPCRRATKIGKFNLGFR